MTETAKASSKNTKENVSQTKRWTAAAIAGFVVVVGAFVGFGTSGRLEGFKKQIQLDWRPWAPPQLSWVWPSYGDSSAKDTCGCPVSLHVLVSSFMPAEEASRKRREQRV